ncbi:MAG: AAA family ATPase [Sulfurospirillum sp.]|nr:AAA family ATPase [Sulfurospirillum sp.]MBL0702353.1 AAA family ATPase [Sulfurospirillum sp.]
MKINTIKLKNYRKFKDLTIDFSDDITLIVGQNSA